MQSRDEIIRKITASLKQGIDPKESTDHQATIALLEQDALTGQLKVGPYIIGRLKESELQPLPMVGKHIRFNGANPLDRFVHKCNLPYSHFAASGAPYDKFILISHSSKTTSNGEKLATILIQGKELNSYVDQVMKVQEENVKRATAEAAQERATATREAEERQRAKQREQQAQARAAEQKQKEQKQEFIRLEQLFKDKDPAELKAKEFIDRLSSVIKELDYLNLDKSQIDSVKQSLVRSQTDPKSYEKILAEFIQSHDRAIANFKMADTHLTKLGLLTEKYHPKDTATTVFLHIDKYFSQRLISSDDYEKTLARLNTAMEGLVKRYKLKPEELNNAQIESKKAPKEKILAIDIAKQKYKDIHALVQDLQSMSKTHPLLQTYDYSTLKTKLQTLSENMPRTERYGIIGAAFSKFRSENRSQSGREIDAIKDSIDLKERTTHKLVAEVEPDKVADGKAAPSRFKR